MTIRPTDCRYRVNSFEASYSAGDRIYFVERRVAYRLLFRKLWRWTEVDGTRTRNESDAINLARKLIRADDRESAGLTRPLYVSENDVARG